MGNARRFSGKAGALLGLIVVAVAAAPTVATAAASACPEPTALATTDFSRGFVQTRHLDGISAPLVSKGVVTVEGDRVDWHTQQPFDILTSVGPNEITQSIDGAEPSRLAAGSDDAIVSVVAALAALLRGNLDSLEQTFEIRIESPDPSGAWTATLTPVDETVMELVGSMTVVGCETVERVTLRRPSGDHDRIEMHPLASP